MQLRPLLNSPTNHYHNYLKATADFKAPYLVLDLDRLDQNIQDILKIAKGHKIRVASKSVRSQFVLNYLKEKLKENYQGIMCFRLDEGMKLCENGFKDLLMGYPIVDKKLLEEFIQTSYTDEITLMVDLAFHLDLLEEIGEKYQKTFRICLDMDMSVDFPGLHFGVWRSSLRDKKSLEKILLKLKEKKWLKLVGLMGYEAQVAGVTDNLLLNTAKNTLIRLLKKQSLKIIAKRREEMVRLVKSFGHELEFVNGGGTGSLKSTIEEKVVTEVTVGSGFYSPALFDYYQDFHFKPALFYALDVTRNPKDNIYTCAGGGHTASGAIEKIKAPSPYLPEGMSLLSLEGAGEVQTPIHYQGPEKLLGSRVFFRHAKAGEVCEYFSHIICLKEKAFYQKVPTYRGDHLCPL